MRGSLCALAWRVALGLAVGMPVLVSANAWACFNASHARRIVLGSSRGAVVVLELDWMRVDRGPEGTLRWKGPVRVGLLDAPGEKLRDVRKLPAADFKLGRHSDDTDAIKREIRAGLAVARSYPGFRAATLPQHQSCDFERSCDGIRIGVDDGGIALFVTQPGAELKVPVALPKGGDFDDGGDAPTTKDELMSWLELVSLLRYDVDGREVLVVDLGGGDHERGQSEAGLWPPCGCEDVSRCPPVAATMHHGSQFEVVIPLATPARARNAMPPSAPSASPLDAGELSRAEGQPKAILRTNGIYAAEPICGAKNGWTRRFFRFFADGTVPQVDGNVTPKDAFRTTAKDGPWVFPEGPYKVTGRRVSATFLENESYTQRRKWELDGILEDNGVRAMSASATTRTTPAFFRFIPVN